MNDSNAYSDRIQRVVDYLAAHLDDELDLEALARVAYFSPYHFHRIYRGLLGETASETVRRLRLHRAALDLLDHKLSIERTAHRAGYASPVRSPRGRDIMAACGQLKSASVKMRASDRLAPPL